MVTVLLAQELGLGRWHAGLLDTIAAAIEQLAPGTRLCFVLPDVVTGASVIGRPAAPIFAAPHYMPGATQRRAGPTRSFGDILCDAGWGNPQTLSALVESWWSLLEVVRPDVIVADHAPTLLLAARSREFVWPAKPSQRTKIPVVSVGLGFTSPPTDTDTFPGLLSRGVTPFDAASHEAPLLAAARRFDPTLPTLPAALSATTSFVTCLDVLDPYRDQRHTAALGIVEPVPGVRAWPDSPGPALAYLSADDTRTLPLLAALAGGGLRVRVYLRDADPNLLTSFRHEPGADLLELSPEPLPLAELLETAPLVIHHGGAGTVHQAVSAGRPQLLLPRYLEQALNAQALVGRGVAALVPQEPEHTVGVVDRLLSGRAPKIAQAWARLVEAEKTPDAAVVVAREVLRLAAGPSA